MMTGISWIFDIWAPNKLPNSITQSQYHTANMTSLQLELMLALKTPLDYLLSVLGTGNTFPSGSTPCPG